ncbi:hypothetical protein TRFO_09822 [Tritrichomonas foetus]|uniref:Uncharacterized protein n=1 Tax=Tritrichomonas foetus TaxID=1144522 RepID=A0A1J4JG94_9EUKA|nr:hypothetical protein TRFO_09822 [Tritrichomonas foetus]|eukprot:OHS96667.1 hypothetical protein TRFO_09822 [Tritrichomonas foetus]
MKKRNLHGLNNPNDEFFIEELAKIPTTLKEEDSYSFFKHILSLFASTKITNDVGNEILLTICKLLTLENHLQIFIDNCFVSNLPLDNFLLIDNILNILDILASKNPSSITREALEPIARRSPYKTLFLLAKMAQKEPLLQNDNNLNQKNSKNNSKSNSKNTSKNNRKDYNYEEEDESDEKNFSLIEKLDWISLLFESESFKRPECAENFISLLVYLLDNSDSFYREFSRKVWMTICSLLQSQNDNIIKYAYVSLCYLIDNEICSHSTLPFSLIANHLSKISLQKSAFSLLIRCNFQRMKSPELVKILIQHATSNKKATLVLLRLSQTENGVDLLINNSSWMGTGLPDKLTTMNLFCNVLLHKEQRESLATKTRDVVNFLSSAFSIEDEKNPNLDTIVVSVLCTILRRIPFDENLVKQLSRHKFLTAYFGRTTRQDTPRNAIYALHVINLVADCCYTKELSQVIDFLIHSIKKNDDNSNFALLTAANLCKYKECVEKLKEKKIVKYILDLDTNTKYQRRFLQAIGAIY